MKITAEGPTIRVGDVTLTILESTTIEHFETESGFIVSARKEPHTVVLRSAGEEITMRLDGRARDSLERD